MRTHPNAPALSYGGVIVAVALFLGFSLVAPYSNSQDKTCTVEGKDRTSQDGASDMRIYTEDCGVLKVGDLFWAGENNSADLYADIEEGSTYEFRTTGFRIGLFTMFPMIRSAQQVAPYIYMDSEGTIIPDPTPSAEADEDGLTIGDSLSLASDIETLPVGTLVRNKSETVTFERVADGFLVVGQSDVKPVGYVATFAPVTVVYLP